MINKILSVLVKNHPGVLSRISGLFHRIDFNIESIAAGTTENPDVSRITIIVCGEDSIIKNIINQFKKLIDVIVIKQLGSTDSVCKELAMIKVNYTPDTINEIIQIAEIHRAKIVDVSTSSIIVELSDITEKVNDLRNILMRFGIKEMVRTGAIAIEKGDRSIII